jgi:hypothetical protein
VGGCSIDREDEWKGYEQLIVARVKVEREKEEKACPWRKTHILTAPIEQESAGRQLVQGA